MQYPSLQEIHKFNNTIYIALQFPSNKGNINIAITVLQEIHKCLKIVTNTLQGILKYCKIKNKKENGTTAGTVRQCYNREKGTRKKKIGSRKKQ